MAGFWFYAREHKTADRRNHLLLAGALLVFLVIFALIKSRIPMILMTHFTFAFLVWHFLKQSYGVARFFGGRRVLFYFSLAIGMVGYLGELNALIGQTVFNMMVPGLALSADMLNVISWALWTLIILVVAETYSAGNLKAAVPIVALDLWFHPSLANTPAKAMLPLFHGLQYLTFCCRRLDQSVHHENIAVKTNRQVNIIGSWFLLGLVYFLVLPFFIRHANGILPYPERLIAASLIFINVLHFLVDGMIWRKKQSTPVKV